MPAPDNILSRFIVRPDSLFGRDTALSMGLVLAIVLTASTEMPSDNIETNIYRIVVPASFGDLFYGFCGHVTFVRNCLRGETAPRAGGPKNEATGAASRTIAS